MKIKKICEYLSEIGILELKDLNYFLKIYSQIENNKCKREIDRLKICLFIYINSISKNDNHLFKICRNIIDSYLNTQLVLKYKALNSFSNIFKNKLKSLFNLFFYKLNLFVLNKKKSKFIVQPVYYRQNKLENHNKNNINKSKEEYKDYKGKIRHKFNINDINNDPKDRITADDVRECTFAPSINEYKPYKENKENTEQIKSFTYYTPSFNILAKIPDNIKNIKNIKNYNNENYYLNNITDIERLKTYNDNNNTNKYGNRKSNSSSLDIHNYSSQIKNDLNYDNNNYYHKNNCLYIINKDNNINKKRSKTPRQQASLNTSEIFNNFLLKQNKHVKDVERKIMNLKLEERNKEEKECSFSPEIHSYNVHNRYTGYLENLNNYYNNNSKNRNSNLLTSHYNSSSSNRSNINIHNNNGICRKFEGSLSPIGDNFTKELYNIGQSSNSKKRINSVGQEFFDKLSKENKEKDIRIQDLRDKVMNEIYTFSPKIEYNDKYKIKGSFEERQKEYIQNKKRLENKKDEDEKIYIDEMNKMYMPKYKSKNKDIINRLYDKEIEKMKKDKKNDEKKKRNVINWNKRYKESKDKNKNKNKNKNNNNFMNIYYFNKKNKIIENKKDKDKIEINNNELKKDNNMEKKEENKEMTLK